jgi:hypothetical protein
MRVQLCRGIVLSCIGSVASLRAPALTLGRALRFLASLQHPSNDLAAQCVQSKQKASSLHADSFDLAAARNWECLLDSGSECIPVVLGTCVSRLFYPSSSSNNNHSSPHIQFVVNTTFFLFFGLSSFSSMSFVVSSLFFLFIYHTYNNREAP